MARLAQKVVAGDRRAEYYRFGMGRVRAAAHAFKSQRLIVLVEVVAGPPSEEKHVDVHLVHRVVLVVEQADQTDVARLHVQVASVGHAEVEAAEPEEHAVRTVEPLRVGHVVQSRVGGVQRDRLELYDADGRVVADGRVHHDSCQADLG